MDADSGNMPPHTEQEANMPLKIGDVELDMGPREVGGLDGLRRTIIDFIDGAKKKLDIAVQELDNKEITKTIVRARPSDEIDRIIKVFGKAL